MRFWVGVVSLALAFAAHSQTPVASGGVVKIGILSDLSGPFSPQSGRGALVSAELAAEDFGGKVLGFPIQVISGDHQNKPDTGATLARSWFERDGVDMINDLTGSNVALAVAELAKQFNRVAMVNGSATVLLTNEKCTPNTVHFAYDTYSTGKSLAQAVIQDGGKGWFFVTQDAAGGHGIEKSMTDLVQANGGIVVGSTKHPMTNTDFSSYLLSARSSKADVIAFANGGADTVNSMKAAQELGIKNQKLVAPVAQITDIHALGLQNAQGMLVVAGFYWDLDDETRKFARRFFERTRTMPSDTQAGIYSSTLLYLNGIKKAGTDNATQVMKAMRELPINDVYKKAKLRADGSVMHPMYVMQVKAPAESKYPWDYYRLIKSIPGEEAYQPMDKSRCPLVTNK